MPRKIHKAEEIVSKLRQVDVLMSQGTAVADAVRSIGVTQVTYYRWRREYGGLQMDQVKRTKGLELENQRLRKAVSDLTLDKLILAEAAKGNGAGITTPSAHTALSATSHRRLRCSCLRLPRGHLRGLWPLRRPRGV